MASANAHALVLIVTAAACGGSSNSSDAPDAGVNARQDAGAAAPVKWVTPTVSLEADDFYYVADNVTFSFRPSNADIHSDPGDATYTTLELTWSDNDVEARTYIYFEADAANWWANEIRTYDRVGQDWLYYDGPFFQTARAGTFQGDLDVQARGVPGINRIHFSNLRLKAFR